MERQAGFTIETKQMQETKDRVRELYYAVLDLIYKCIDYDRDFSSESIFDELSEEEYRQYQREAEDDMQDSYRAIVRLQEYSALDLPQDFNDAFSEFLKTELAFLPEDIVTQLDRPDENFSFLDGGYKEDLKRVFRDYYLS